MADKRIIELEERLTLSDGDYFATDNTNGTCKVNAKILLDRLSDNEDAIATKAAKVDLTNISITGSTNNTGSTIASGTYFYKNGTLVKAIAAIANGATLTLNTNYEIVTAGGLNDLNNALTPIASPAAETHSNNFSAVASNYTKPIYFTLNKGTYLIILNGTWTVSDLSKRYGIFLLDVNNTQLAGIYGIAQMEGSISKIIDIATDGTKIYGGIYNESSAAINASLSLQYKKLA